MSCHINFNLMLTKNLLMKQNYQLILKNFKLFCNIFTTKRSIKFQPFQITGIAHSTMRIYVKYSFLTTNRILN